MVTITKIKSKLENPHPNKIEEGYSRTGFMEKWPEVGKPFTVQRIGGWFTTSNVTKITTKDESTFILETENSIYEVDLGPGDDE